MVRARKQYHHHHHNNHHRHAPYSHFYRHYKRAKVPSAPSNTTQFIMNDHELIEPNFDLMHSAIMEHYDRNKQRKLQQHNKQAAAAARQKSATTTTEAATPTTTKSATTMQQQTTSSSNNSSSSCCSSEITTQLQESTNQSNPTTPSYRPLTGSPGDEDGFSPFINHEHLQSEFQEVYADIHTERLSSMSKNQLVNKYLLLEERVEELENQLRQSQTATTAPTASHGLVLIQNKE